MTFLAQWATSMKAFVWVCRPVTFIRLVSLLLFTKDVVSVVGLLSGGDGGSTGAGGGGRSA